MKLLRSILTATACHSTHHRFALDALPLVQTESGIRLARLLLRHFNRYLIGAIDPDIRFCDFQNHVIHTNDDYWGGAPRVAHAWYERLQKYLRTNRFADAAHAAGVLSHYFTDVLQPLHTGTSQREAVIHFPFECSVSQLYHRIWKGWQDDDMRIVFQLSDRQGWLGEAMLHSARYASRKRERILDGYSLELAREDLSQGLDGNSRAALSELFGLAITGLARVIERAGFDSESRRGEPLPVFSLGMPTLMAGLQSPWRYTLNQARQWFRQQAAVDLIDEFQQTGGLREHLPAEVDITHRVVKVYEDERQWRLQLQQRLQSNLTVVGIENEDESEPDDANQTVPLPRSSSYRRSA